MVALQGDERGEPHARPGRDPLLVAPDRRRRALLRTMAPRAQLEVRHRIGIITQSRQLQHLGSSGRRKRLAVSGSRENPFPIRR
jgi:hypothetical protein